MAWLTHTHLVNNWTRPSAMHIHRQYCNWIYWPMPPDPPTINTHKHTSKKQPEGKIPISNQKEEENDNRKEKKKKNLSSQSRLWRMWNVNTMCDNSICSHLPVCIRSRWFVYNSPVWYRCHCVVRWHAFVDRNRSSWSDTIHRMMPRDNIDLPLSC